MYRAIAIRSLAAFAGCFISDILAATSGAETQAALTWTGEVVPGGGTVIYVGNDIHDILDQIHVTNPNYDATPDVRSTGVDKANVQSVKCGVFATADKKNFEQIQYDLRKTGGNCSIPSHTCLRLACWNTSGISSVFDQDNDIAVTYTCVTFVDFASRVGRDCCKSSYTKSKGLSGQAFSDEGWNVGVGYANCNHPKDKDAPGIFIPPGLNGECKN